MIEITVNGQTQELDDGLSLTALLDRMGLAEKKVAVECNGEIVPRSEHAQRTLGPGDRIEIVHAIGGG